MADRYDDGRATRRAVLGEAHVDRSEARATGFDADFQAYVTECAWGAVWSRSGLTRRERSLVTLAILAARGQWEEFALHTRATAATGASPDDLREMLLHVAAYAGIPAANNAFRIARETLEREGRL
jgi:4-carboxymuconolactone decarboxylase